MSVRFRPLGGLVAAVAVLALTATPAQAQFGRLKDAIKKKAVDAAATAAGVKDTSSSSSSSSASAGSRATVSTPTGGHPATHATPQASAAIYGGNVLEMTPDVLDRFAQALNAEAAHEKQAKIAEARLLPPDKRSACTLHLYQTSAERQRMQKEYEAAMKKQDMAGMQKAGNEIMAFENEHCPARNANSVQALHKLPPDVLTSANLTSVQYAVLKERVAPFCRSAPTATAEGARIQGRGNNVFYAYSATEVNALQPRCKTLMPVLQPLL